MAKLLTKGQPFGKRAVYVEPPTGRSEQSWRWLGARELGLANCAAADGQLLDAGTSNSDHYGDREAGEC